jgi:SAM-dependent methyltransferase
LGLFLTETSPWIARWGHLVPAHGTVLDIGCGHGRHMKHFAELGHAVTGIDRAPEALATASAWGETVLADIEIEGNPWPLMIADKVRTFDAVIVTNYLWRPLLGVMAQSLAPGGVLIYETFARGNETVGKPSRPDFLLENGELLRAFPTLRVIAYEDGFLSEPARFVQRLVAVAPHLKSFPERDPEPYPKRYLLSLK